MNTMGVIGADRTKNVEKCIVCENTFPEDQLELEPYNKTKTLELMCIGCKSGAKAELDLTSEKQTDKNKIKTEKKPNEIKEIVNEQAEPIKNARGTIIGG